MIMKKDRSSAYELQIPGTFSIGGIARNHDYSGTDAFFIFGKEATSPYLIKIADYETSSVEATYYCKNFLI